MVTTSSGTGIDLGEIGSITTDVKYEKVAAEEDDYRTVTADQDTVQQLCEKLYSDLKLNSNNTDDFGRPAATWQYKKSDVATVAKTAEARFTAKTSNADVLKELKGLTYNGKKISVANDVQTIANSTANGKLVEVFAKDNVIGEDDVIEVIYTVGKVPNSDDLTIPEGGTLTLDGAATVAKGKTVTVEEGGTLIVNGDMTTKNSEVELNGGSIERGSKVDALPKITGKGEVKIDGTIKGVGKDDSEKLTNLAESLGQEKVTVSKASMEEDKNGASSKTITLKSGDIVLTGGSGKLKAWNTGETIDQWVKANDGNPVSLFVVKLTGLDSKDNIKGYIVETVLLLAPSAGTQIKIVVTPGQEQNGGGDA